LLDHLQRLLPSLPRPEPPLLHLPQQPRLPDLPLLLQILQLQRLRLQLVPGHRQLLLVLLLRHLQVVYRLQRLVVVLLQRQRSQTRVALLQRTILN
jgi:hypothetical protein